MVRPVLASVVAILSVAAGCGDGASSSEADAAVADDGGEPDAPAAADARPLAIRVEGTAEATVEGTDERVECSFFADVADLALADGGWTGTIVAGEVFRRAFDGDDPLFEFQALIGGPASLIVTDAGVEVRIAGDQPDDATPFWLGLEVLEGAATDGPHAYGGDWPCARAQPEEGELPEPDVVAHGTWTAGPT